MSDTLSSEFSEIDVVESIQQEERYFLALGRFTNAFAHAESSLKSFLADLLEIDVHTANAAFGGQRMKPTMDAIRRLHERRNSDLDDLYAPIVEQLGQILKARDGLVHWGARNIATSEAIVTNARYAHTSKAVRFFPISADLLDDIKDIDLRLQLATWRRKIGKKEFIEIHGEVEPPAWRYKHQPKPALQSKKP